MHERIKNTQIYLEKERIKSVSSRTQETEKVRRNKKEIEIDVQLKR